MAPTIRECTVEVGCHDARRQGNTAKRAWNDLPVVLNGTERSAAPGTLQIRLRCDACGRRLSAMPFYVTNYRYAVEPDVMLFKE
jgi:hypothetical protein